MQNDYQTALFDWLLFLKSEREEELQMLAEKNPQLKKAVGVLLELSEDERTRMIEDAREKARRDKVAEIAWAKRTGVEQGIKQGLEKGLERVAKNMLQKQMPVSEVAELTGLSPEEVSELLDTPRS